MEYLYQKSKKKVNEQSYAIKRYLYSEVGWNKRLVCITGARGCGKTTLILQYMKETYGLSDSALYVSLDDLWFSGNTLTDLVREFVMSGGTHLFLDEVHKYKNWSVEIKNAYDQYTDLNITINGSSILELIKGQADLSRRAMFYELVGLSFREYLQFKHSKKFVTCNLEDILFNSTEIISEIVRQIKPVANYRDYIHYGYYPFFLEGIEDYPNRLATTVNMVLETELPFVYDMEIGSVIKIKKLIFLLSSMPPYTPNISDLSRQLGVTRDTLLRFLYYLDKARLISLLTANQFGINYLNKPEKIFLHNPNLFYSINPKQVNSGSLRESFFLNQLKKSHQVIYSNQVDFLVDNKYAFEVGGKNKQKNQIRGIENSFIVKDDIEFSTLNTIPLWLFGFLY